MTTTAIHKFLVDIASCDLPAPVMPFAKLLLLDLIGTGLAGTQTPLHHAVKAYACAHHAHGSAHALFTPEPLSAEGAALLGGMTIDAIDAHDGHKMTKGHVGCAVLPGLLAMIDQEGARPSGEAFLRLLIAGYEIGSRAGLALHESVPDYHTSGAWNALTVAALGTHIRGGTADQLAHALGIAEYHGPRSQMMRGIDHPTMLKDGSGWGALAGVSAANLAAFGFTGAPAISITHPDRAQTWSGLGTRWEILNQYIKLFPVCRWAQPPLAAIATLTAKVPLDPAAIHRVNIHSFHEAIRLFQGVPTSTEEAQYAISWPVAALLTRGKLGVEEISQKAFSDPAIQAMNARIHYIEEPAFNARFPAERIAQVTVTLKGGESLISEPVQARGDPETPLSEDEILAKFDGFAVPIIGQTKADALRQAVLELDQSESSFVNLRELLSAPVAPD